MPRDRKRPERNRAVARSRSKLNRHAAHGILGAIMLVALPLYLWGIRRDLPVIYEIDEPPFVQAAARIAGSGSLNPGWFGHPGSTLIYPLAVLYEGFDIVDHREFMTNIGQFYFLGRLVTVAYALLSLPLVWLIGRLAFDTRVGLVGAWFALLCPLTVEQIQQVRTDAPAIFFTLLALWLCLRLYERFTTRAAVLAGVAVGLAVSTKYSLAVLALVVLAVDCAVAWHSARADASKLGGRQIPWGGIAAGLLAIPLTFLLTTPYFFLDHATALENIRTEARSTHLGADGLTPIQNFYWYADVIVGGLGRGRALLAVAGLALALWKRRPQQLLLLAFAVVYLVEVSLHPLHWSRWVIPILPLCMLFAAAALSTAAAQLGARLRWRPRVEATLVMLATCALSYVPASAVITSDALHAHPSTRILAREWVLQHFPPGTRIAQEWFTAPLNETEYDIGMQFSLATNQTLESYRQLEYRYLLVSSAVYGDYLNQPSRYPSEAAFYKQLFAEGHLLQEFAPSALHGGPTVRIYELRPSAE